MIHKGRTGKFMIDVGQHKKKKVKKKRSLAKKQCLRSLTYSDQRLRDI